MSREALIAEFLARHGYAAARAEPLARIGVLAPKISAADPAVGLLLEEDLGDRLLTCGWDTQFLTLPGCVGEAAEGVGSLILDNVVDALVAMQRGAPLPGLSLWNAATMAPTVMPIGAPGADTLDRWIPPVRRCNPPDLAA